MITIGMWVGFFLGMYITNSLFGYTLCGILGIWCGAGIGTACSDTQKEAWIINKKEAIRLSWVFALAFVVRMIAETFISNQIIILIVHLAAIMIFDSWHRIKRGAVDWQQLVCIGGGILAGIAIIIKFDIPAWIGFFIPIVGAIVGSIAYNKFVHPQVKNNEKELLLGCRLYGILAAMDGGVTIDEENYFRSRFAKMLPNEAGGASLISEFYNAARDNSEWDIALSDFVKTVYLNQSENIDDWILDLCFFALLRQNGDISTQRRNALKKVAEEFDIPLFFFERLLADLKANFNGAYFQDENHHSNNIEQCFSLLGCSSNASYDEVKRAYRMKSRLNHPDKVKSYGFDDRAVANATRKMQSLNDAYTRIKEYKGWK